MCPQLPQLDVLPLVSTQDPSQQVCPSAHGGSHGGVGGGGVGVGLGGGGVGLGGGGVGLGGGDAPHESLQAAELLYVPKDVCISGLYSEANIQYGMIPLNI